MKKIEFNPKKWKLKKRQSFHVYFILFATLVVTISSSLPPVVLSIINRVFGKNADVPEVIIVSAIGLLVGVILSFFTGKILLAPIKKLQKAMEKVTDGNFDVTLDEGSMFDEVEDINHNFNLMVKELRATETIQTDFISNASHEFKTPLNAIEGYATLLTDPNINDTEKNIYLDKILFNTKRMNQLVNNVLLLSKLENHSISKQNNTYFLDEQIRQSILFLESKWTEKNIEFDIDFETVKFYGSESLMVHVWNNLISNAIKFSPEHGTVKMILKVVDDMVVFSISDQGPGVNEENIKYIFNKFYQADTSHKSEGYGLGLSLTKKIVDLSYGQITVENIPEGGCKFTVSLPKATQ